MKVTNINGTSDNQCQCGSWKQHWINISGKKWPTYCSEEKCIEAPVHGAHVQKSTGNDWYIIPLCADHNGKHGETIVVIESTMFVSANRQKTCEK